MKVNEGYVLLNFLPSPNKTGKNLFLISVILSPNKFESRPHAY